MELGFAVALRDKLIKDLNLIVECVDVMEAEYRAKQPEIPGAPLIQDLTVDDMVPLSAINNIAVDNGETWEMFKKRKLDEHQVELDVFNPFLPNWQSKTDDKQSIWTSDSGAGFSDMGKNKLTSVIRDASPVLNKDVGELVGTLPTTDATMLIEILKFCISMKKLFVWNLGDGDNATFRWGPSLCLLMGLGDPAVRMFAEQLGDEGDWQYWARCSNKQLVDDVLDAHKICAYPVGLFRCDFAKVSSIIEDEYRLDFAPKWYKPFVALHIAKHCRFLTQNGTSSIFCAYQGRQSLIPLDPGVLNQPLSAGANQALRTTLCSILRLPNKTKKRKGESVACDRAAADVLSYVTPMLLPRGRDPKSLINLIPAIGVVIETTSDRYSEHRWIDPGIMVSNIAHIDTETGEVNKNAVVTGPLAMAVQWPRAEVPLPVLLAWQSIIPDRVSAELPSTILRRFIRNLNDLGHPEGFDAYLNATILLDLMRDEIAGTPVGNSIMHEFPLIFVMPTGATEETTTNQGKTTVARMIGQTMTPGLADTACLRSSSPPTQRLMAATLESHGSAIFDEFILPQSHDHFLNQTGLQSFATGTGGGPGRAQENSTGIVLKHPICFSAKIAAFPADILNRMMPIFLDALSDETRATDSEQDALNSGKAPLLMRLSAILWMAKNNFIAEVKKLSPVSGPLRFKGHQAVCLKLLGVDDKGKLADYIAAATAQSIAQRDAADESGLADSIGVNSSFNPEYYFQSCDEPTLDALYITYENYSKNQKKPLLVREVMVMLVEDNGKRQFKREIESYHIKEPTAFSRLTKALKTKPFVRGLFTMRVVILDPDMPDARSRPQTHIVVEKRKPTTDSNDSPTDKV